MLTGHAPNPGTLDPHAQAMVVCVLQHLIDTKAEPSPALGFAMAQLPPEALPLCCTFLGEASPRFVELVPVCVGRVLKWPLTADVGESHVLTTRQRATVGRTHVGMACARDYRAVGVGLGVVLLCGAQVQRGRAGCAVVTRRRCVTVEACVFELLHVSADPDHRCSPVQSCSSVVGRRRGQQRGCGYAACAWVCRATSSPRLRYGGLIGALWRTCSLKLASPQCRRTSRPRTRWRP